MLTRRVGIDFSSSTMRGCVLGEEKLLSATTTGYSAGVIIDPPAVERTLSDIVDRTSGFQRIFRPDIMIAVPVALSGKDRFFLMEAAANAGARTMALIDRPFAAIVGRGRELSVPPVMVICCGDENGDVAVVNRDGIIACSTVRGDDILGAVHSTMDDLPAQLQDGVLHRGVVATGEMSSEFAQRLAVDAGFPIDWDDRDIRSIARGAALLVGGVAQQLTLRN